MHSYRGATLSGLTLLVLALFAQCCSAYQVLISDTDDVRQVCSGMWGTGGKQPFIEVLFSPSARGQLALVIFEWEDAIYLGVDKEDPSADNHWSDSRVYICTLSALQDGLCKEEELGHFITSPTMPIAEHTIFTQSVRFDTVGERGPFRYPVRRTGYYCVGVVPITTDTSSEAQSSFTGVVDFENIFPGHLPASEYPKIFFYGSLALIYLALGIGWGVICYQNRGGLLAIQHYITGIIVLLMVEMTVIYRYYSYLNGSGHPEGAKGFLLLVAVLGSARNSLSFFMLLITAMGYGVVRPSLGPIMMKARSLGAIHFIFGILYSVGTASVPMETAGFLVFFFVVPLAFSLTAFLMWIMWSLNATIGDLASRKQTYKKTMFINLHRVLLFAVIVIVAFFIISSLSFSSRLSEDFGPTTWQTSWILLDGWLGILYLVVFSTIAFLWRPTSNNQRLALSDELPTDEREADEFEVDSLEREAGDKDAVQMRGLRGDNVVFDVGDDEDEEEGVGMGGMGGTGENRPLRLETSEEDDEDEAGPPPSYKRGD